MERHAGALTSLTTPGQIQSIPRHFHFRTTSDARTRGVAMPLVTCADCGKQISDASPACIHCGRPMGNIGRATAATPPIPPAPRGNPAFRCPNCGSEDVRRLSVVHASGLSTTQASSSAVGLGVGGDGDLGLAGGVISSSGIQETALARAAAPPTPMTVSTTPAATWGCLAGLVAAAVIGSAIHTESADVLSFLGWAAVAALVGRAIYKTQYSTAKEHNDRFYRPKKAIWDRSIMCMRCGAITQQDAVAPKPLLD
jgi:DNA-directed RNA polymerase subunit RPC12/RpoP